MAEKMDCCKAAKNTEDLALKSGGLGRTGYGKCRGSWTFGRASYASSVVESVDGGCCFENPFRSINDQKCLALAVLELVAVVELE